MGDREKDLFLVNLISFVLLVFLHVFDIKDVETVFPDVVYSVIINLPCKRRLPLGPRQTQEDPLWISDKKRREEGEEGGTREERRERTKLPPNSKCRLPDKL